MSTASTAASTPRELGEVTRFLVPLDGIDTSTPALAVAAALAGRLGAVVEVIDCLPPQFHGYDEGAWIDEQLEAVGLPADGATTVQSTVHVVEAIVANAAKVPGTVVCMASHGRNAVGELIFGSVTHDVIVASPAPVLVVGPQCTPPTKFECIEVCVDGSHASETLVDVAIAWAGRLGAVPWLTQVVEDDVPVDFGGGGRDVIEGSSLVRLAHGPRAAGIEIEWDVLHGRHPGRAIAAWAAEHDVALVVTGSHGRTGMQRVRLGSVTGSLIHELTCPLLVVGPYAIV